MIYGSGRGATETLYQGQVEVCQLQEVKAWMGRIERDPHSSGYLMIERAWDCFKALV